MSLMDEFKKIIHPYDDEDDDYEEDVGRDSEPTYFEPREPRESSRRKEVPAEERRNKVVNIHATTQLKVVLVKPERFENASEIADHLREKRTVVLNLEGTNKDVARRLVDFLSGVAYAFSCVTGCRSLLAFRRPRSPISSSRFTYARPSA